MPEVFETSPNVVHVIMQDQTGRAERFAVGLDLDTVIAKVTAALAGATPTVVKKARKKRTPKATPEEDPSDPVEAAGKRGRIVDPGL